MNSQEAAIKESRLILATKNDLMGANGKLGIICRYLGSKIEAQTGFEYWNEEEVEIAQLGESDGVLDVGWIFDGLSRGMHLEVKYIDYDNKLTVTHKGHEVYCEISGNLESYVPNPDWESKIEKLFSIAMERKKRDAQHQKIEKEELITKKQSNFMEYLKQKWGW